MFDGWDHSFVRWNRSSFQLLLKIKKNHRCQHQVVNWLYVGGSGPGNYSVVQDAIDNASDGNTVYVYPGVYSDFSTEYGCILINKVISLIGENKLNTILNGTGYARVLIVDADEVTVSGFTGQNGGAPELEGYFGIGIDVANGHRNVRIYDNIITENQAGICDRL